MINQSDILDYIVADLIDIIRLHNFELDNETLAAIKEVEFPNNLGIHATTPEHKAIYTEMAQAVKQLDSKELDNLASDFADVYLNYKFRASPSESVWFDEDNLERQQPMFEVRKYYEKYNLAVDNWKLRSDDHMVHQIQFIVYVLTNHRKTESLQEIAKFMDEHILRWIGKFAKLVYERSNSDFYRYLAILTANYLSELRQLLVAFTGLQIPTVEEIDKRMSKKPRIPVANIPPKPAKPSW